MAYRSSRLYRTSKLYRESIPDVIPAAVGEGTLEFVGDATGVIPTYATGDGTFEFIGDGTAWHGLEAISAIGAGTLAFIGDATMLAPATATGYGTLEFVGDATGFVAPASSAIGAIEFIGDGIGVCAVIVDGDGSLSFTGAGVGGVGVSAVGAGTLEFVGAGGYYPIAIGDGALEFTGAASGNVGNDARGRWLRIHTVPLSQVYAIDAIRGRLDQRESMHKCQFDVTATAAQLGARNDTFGVTLTGAGSRLRARLVSQAAYGVRIDVMDGGAVSRSGVTSGIQLGDEIELDCEADGWASLLPHRTNADLGLFRDVEVLPWRYGREVPGRCVRLDAAGRVWLWADHASQRIRSVQIDGQDFDAWQWRNEASEYGQPVTLILTDGVDDGVEMTAIGDGALDEIGGHLIVNPADMLMSLCARGGVTLSRGDTAEFRAECLARSIEVSGTIGAMSLQQSLVLLSESIYACFSRELAGVMRLLPRTGTARTIAPRYTPTASAERSDVATRLRVRYALDDDDKPRASADFRAAAVEALRGVMLAEYTLPLVRDGRTAADVATRMLQDMSRPSYTVPIERQRARVVPGDLVSVSVPRYGLTGDAVVRSASIGDDGSTPVGILRHGAAPSVTLTQMSSAYSPEQYVSATMTTRNDERRFRITDPAQRPIVGARCTLNGSLTRVTDAVGVVEFPVSAMPAGQHVITIIADGLEPMRLDVVV